MDTGGSRQHGISRVLDTLAAAPRHGTGLLMNAFASDKTVRLGAEGLVLWAEIHNEGDVNVVVLKCHGGVHSKQSNFNIGES